MTSNIHLHKNDLPEDLKLGNTIAVDGEFMGLNVRRDPLCLYKYLQETQMLTLYNSIDIITMLQT